MSIIATPRTGRQLMVLDDAESIAHQARRRAVVRKRRFEALQMASGVAVVASIIAVVLGVSLQAIILVLAAVFGVGSMAYRRVRDHQISLARRRGRASIGQGIGTPRPKGAFSTTRHRSGEPVWIDRRAA